MSRQSQAIGSLPSPVRRSLAKLGDGLKVARKRRRITVRQMAERMLVSVDTLVRLEKGDPTVALGVLASALWALGLHERLAEVADPDRDEIGRHLELTRLPKRVRPKPTEFDF